MNKKWDLRFLEMAEFVAQWSKDPSTKTGAVIVGPDRDVISTGYNGFARGVNDSKKRYANRELKYKMVVHCECNAILFADRYRLKGSTLYTYPFMSCSACAKHVIQAGIKRCVAPVIAPETAVRWGDDIELSKEMFKEAGIKLKFYDFLKGRK